MRLLISVAIFLIPFMAHGHGLLMDARSDAETITGRLYYTNGDLAVGESIALVDLMTASATPVYQRTDSDARFTFRVTPSHKYRISAFGEEGHTVELELIAQAQAKPELVDEARTEEGMAVPPAWALIGGALLLSLVPATRRRMRARGANAVSGPRKN